MKAVKFKLGANMGSGLMYRVYHNQGHGPITLRITSLDRFYNFAISETFCHAILKSCKSYKVETITLEATSFDIGFTIYQ